MNKRMLAIVACLFVGMIFSGCCVFHEWQNATCEAPSTCSKCGETKGSSLGGHVWPIANATCEQDKECARCGKIAERATGHRWQEATEETPYMCMDCNAMEPMDLPANGQVFIGKGENRRGSTLTIRSSTSNACYIKLKDLEGVDAFSFFVRAGETVTANVPNGLYYVYFAYGDEWYGTKYVFGPETTYAKDDEICDFYSYSWEYTLYPSYGGNFSETPISGDEF